MNALESVLRLVAEGGIHSYEELARRLPVPPPLLEPMIEDLARLGYLRAVSSCSGPGSEGCAGCAHGCALAGPRRTWALTEKGARAAERLAG